ncbi:MAG: YraN family protein [Patescibacteria group bacterium]|nr:YraN family protein [Patescibacteria group bacterium]MBU1870758.1 YraN family protein [Patescibacteria group bacterium]
MEHKQLVGKFGEKLAQNYLIKKGYQIIEINKKISYKEIDIVAKYGNLLVFVEVKTRMSSIFGKADEAMTYQKTNNFKKAVEFYANNYDIAFDNVRLDLISIDIDKEKKTAKIKHYQDIV